jgi:hypothetical protein
MAARRYATRSSSRGPPRRQHDEGGANAASQGLPVLRGAPPRGACTTRTYPPSNPGVEADRACSAVERCAGCTYRATNAPHQTLSRRCGRHMHTNDSIDSRGRRKWLPHAHDDPRGPGTRRKWSPHAHDDPRGPGTRRKWSPHAHDDPRGPATRREWSPHAHDDPRGPAARREWSPHAHGSRRRRDG